MRTNSMPQSDILQYIIEKGLPPGENLPTIQHISEEMDVSVAKTREGLEVARALGIVEVKPGRGTRVAEYSFVPAATLSVVYAIGQDETHFKHIRALRNVIEEGFWAEATAKLDAADLADLNEILAEAFKLLELNPIKVPAQEHRAFHLKIFSRLNNPFVDGILHAYWEAHDAFGLNTYADLSYHQTVWEYHAGMVRAIEAGDAEKGRRLLVEHMNLVRHHKDIERARSFISAQAEH